MCSVFCVLCSVFFRSRLAGGGCTGIGICAAVWLDAVWLDIDDDGTHRDHDGGYVAYAAGVP
jgi:hypothetical protein